MAPDRPVSPACDPKSGEGRKCVCKVCTCGFHKCPQKHTSVHTKFGDKTVSEYCAKYPEWPMPAKYKRKPEKQDFGKAPISSATTYSDDFVKHPHGPAKLFKPPNRNDNTGPFLPYTTYNVDFTEKPMAPRHRMPVQKGGASQKFDGQSLYSVEFTNPGKQPPNKQVRHGDSLGSHGAKFDSDSTYHDDFRQWKMPAKYVHKKQDNPQPTGKIEGPTIYQMDFQNRKIENKCPVFGSKPTIVCGDHMCY
ncbi:hypothetical protein M758_3G059100 [Ceratodon purpureus]|uniref:Uncharacterized protein n=1 Tax=Ceratodon purpureus TaxID=3225 RepID=A0A8T0IFE3_CERPU|nr:hypothetical protein KC19_3G059900 [Ceratodon purpureus]KAG0582440.1 hypothetical protein KC19_3G059900 [Ceratodon purpureus]KAG0621931.1 hypothetical protein M758_3G059100 [Ceratodon purpureus]